MLHSIDTSSFVWAGRRHFPQYPRDVFPSVWAALEGKIQRGEIFICREAFDEMVPKKGSDPLHMWLGEQRAGSANFVRESGENVLEKTREIVRRFPNLPDKDREDDADPCIIAHAIVAGGAVVTQEIPDPRRMLPGEPDKELRKIPEVCRRLGVDCMDLSEFMRRAKMRF